MAFLKAYRQARKDVHIQRAKKKAIRGPDGYLHYMAVGQKQRDDLLSVGWELVAQDVSEHGTWVTRWIMKYKEGNK